MSPLTLGIVVSAGEARVGEIREFLCHPIQDPGTGFCDDRQLQNQIATEGTSLAWGG